MMARLSVGDIKKVQAARLPSAAVAASTDVLNVWVMVGESWTYLEPTELRRSRCSRVCITCQHFRFSADGDGHTVLACGWKQRLIVSGDHLTRRCDQWLVRRELEQGWCPEVA